MTPPIVQSAARLLELAEKARPRIGQQPQEWQTAHGQFAEFARNHAEELATAVIRMEKALRKAEQLAVVASDWNLSEVEIDGEMVGIYDLRDEFKSALTPPSPPPAQIGEKR